MKESRIRKDGAINLKVNDRYIVKNQHCISNVIVVNIVNDTDSHNETISFYNTLESWTLLKTISEIRSVFVERDSGLIPYKESEPYRCRFNRDGK